MIFDELVLHDFGQYRGRVSIALTPPSPEQPIILFGGLNGAGKTTILDALQLCLFGPLARSSRREGLSYEQYLLDSIHRGAGNESAAVELRFRHMSQGEEQRFHIRRSWRKTAKGCREQLEVFRNDQFDTLATDHWAEQVEEFLPSRIAHLFLFDGEQIEAYADPRSAAGLIETAVFNLLGLDLVEKLGSDLSVIERRRRMEVRPLEDQDQLLNLERARDDVVERLESCHARHAKRAAELGRIQAQRREIEARYRKEGGAFYEHRVQIEAAAQAAEARFQATERALRETAAEIAPLLLVRPLAERVAQRAAAESGAVRAAHMNALLTERDAALLRTLRDEQAAESLIDKVAQFLASDRASRAVVHVGPVLQLSEVGRMRLDELIGEQFDHTAHMLRALLEDHRQAARASEEASMQVAAVPTPEALASLTDERDALIAREATLAAQQKAETEELEQLRRELERANIDLRRFELEDVEHRLAEDDRTRVLKHISLVRTTLDQFRDAVIRRHLARIEALVLDSFHQLLRKKALVARLAIEPETFQLRLTGRDGQPLPPERLSAGERQLLATSVLWGLARASARPLPTVIDTPLGRLDSSHRRRLVTHYFPAASHQVLLLSTDEEIAGGYFDVLRPFVGRAYQLSYDDELGATRVENGYFGELAHVD